MPDSTLIDQALVAVLQGDAALMALLPDGVWVNDAPQGAEAFARVSVATAFDDAQMGPQGKRRALETITYEVTAVVQDASRATAGDAATRIDALLDDQPLTCDGYGCLQCSRVERIDETEVDQVDNAIRWQHRGGRYRVIATPTT